MYEAFYKLTGKPFQLTPDPRFFYGSRGHKRAMAYLRYGLNQGEGFITITGGAGTGKTTLVETLFASLANRNIVVARLVTTQLDAEDTLRTIAASFELAHEGLSKAALLKNLETFLKARAREGKRVLLVVDEAQNLLEASLEELRMLSNFHLGERALLQSFLLGQEELRNTLQTHGNEQLRQRVIAAYHLSPLEADETKGYIEHRLYQVAWKNDPRFTDTAYAAIHKHSEGIPRHVNTLCDRLMLYGFLEEAHEINEETVRYVTDEMSQELGSKDKQTPSSAERRSADVETLPGTATGSTHSIRVLERRLVALEDRVEKIEQSLYKDRERLLDALLANLGQKTSVLARSAAPQSVMPYDLAEDADQNEGSN
jgi:putative secretion ATPase, PEP-CTERM locus subfamily